MNPSDKEGIDHHVQTGILIEHIDTAYLNKDLGVRKSIKKFGDLYLQQGGSNKVWANRSTSSFIDSIILSVTRAVVEDSRDRVAKKGRHAPGFYSAYQQKLELDTSEEDDSEEDDWIPNEVVESIDTEAAKAAAQVVSLKRRSTEELQADVDAINQQIAAAQKADAQKSEKLKKARKA